MANDNRRKLFDAMQSAGYDIGSYEDFDRRMNNESDRQKFFIAVNEAGYDIGSYNDFDRRIRDSKYKLNVGGKQVPVSEQQYKEFIARKNQPTQQPITAKPVTQQPTQQVQQQPTQQVQSQPKQQGTPMTEAERRKMSQNVESVIGKSRYGSQQTLNKLRYAQGNTGLDTQPVSLGQNRKVVAGTPTFNPNTGKIEERYITETGNEFESRGQADLVQNQTDEYNEYKNRTVDSELREAYSERDRLLREIRERSKDYDTGNNVIAPAGSVNVRALRMRNDDDIAALQTAYNKTLERITTLEAERDDDGGTQFWRGFTDAATADTWLMGIPSLQNSSQLLKAKRKMERGEQLTPSERTMLEDVVKTDDVAGRYGKNRGKMYEYGAMTMHSLPFMLQFISLGGGLGLATGAARKGGEMLSKLATNAISKWILKQTGRVVGSVAGATAEGSVMANTIGAAGTTADIMQRYIGDVTIDENGNYKFDGGKTLPRAIYEGEVANSLEYGSEVLGGPIDKALGKIAGKMGLSKLTKLYERLGSSTIGRAAKKILDKMQVQSLPGEMLEEEAGMFGKAALGVDNNFSIDPNSKDFKQSVFNLENHLDVVFGIGLSMGMTQAAVTTGVGGVVGIGKISDKVAYRRTKHAVDKADALASFRMTEDKWKPLRDLIDATPNTEMKNLGAKIVADENLHYEEKRAALEYMGQLSRLRGFNLGMEAKARQEIQDAEQSESKGVDIPDNLIVNEPIIEMSEEDIANDNYSAGYDADLQGRRDIAIGLSMSPNDTMAQAAWEGVRKRIEDDADTNVAVDRERARQIEFKDENGNPDGSIRTATLRETDEGGNGKQVYIIAGNVAMTSDGTAVDTSASDKTISIFDPSTGEPRMIDPSEIAALGSVTSAEQYDADIEQKRQDYIQQQIDEAQGTIQIVPGGSVTLPTGEDALVLGTMDADGEDVLVQVGDRRDVVKRSDIQQSADDRAIEDYRQRHGIQEEESMPEEGMQNGAPSEYTNGMEIVIREQDGDYGTFNEKTGLVLRRVRAEMRNGKIEYVPDAEGSLIEYLVGDEVRHDHIADLNNMIVRHSSDVQGETESGSPASLAGIRRERTQDRQQQDEYEPAEEYETPIGGEVSEDEYEPAEEYETPIGGEVSEDEYEPAELPEYGYDEGNYERVMPMVGEGEDAEPDFLATTPQRGHRYLYEEARLTRKVADNIVSANLSAAEKELKKQQKAIDTLDSNPGTSIAQYQKKRRDLEEKLNSAQATHDYWMAVKAEQNKVVAAEAAERARQESALHEQAAIDEQRRQEQELAKRREQEERGVNAVSPAIREKWDNAPKVEGAENEITLANGEIVKGRYMLVESGAATPSHNPNAEFTRNEGFPVDENGQTVNDRDYERDRDAQNITRQMAAQYDSRAIQSVPVVSRDGIVLSGNGRTMAGELAAQNNTDGAYIGHLQKYPQQFGFTTEQVQGMQHPRVVFVPDEAMPYTTDTFAKFNQQDMKSQSRTEQSVKLGKTVDDSIFNRIIQSINTFDSISDFYSDTQASTNAIAELRNAGVINAMQYAEMFDGEKVSMTGRQILENMLVGKAFESNPDAIRQLAEYPSMRQSVISALAEISNNVALGEDYSLETELAEAINLAYQARKSGYKAGDVVSNYARQLNLFPFDEGSETVADYTNAAVLMLADVLNDSRTGMLKKTLALYNREAADSAAGQTDLFSGGVKTKQQILKEVLNILNYGTENQQRTALAAAVEQRKADAAAGQGGGGEGVQPNGTTGESGTEGEAINNDGIFEKPDVEFERIRSLRQALADGYANNDKEAIQKAVDGLKKYVDEGLDSDNTYSEEIDDYEGNDPMLLAERYITHLYQDRYLDDDEDQEYINTGIRSIVPAEQPKSMDEAVSAAEQETDTNPTDAQKEAGNYKKGHVKIDGFDVTIENPKGSIRSGKDASGKAWSVTMNNTYGYIRGTEGVDGDHIDVFLSDDMDGWNGTVYVVDQIKADGTFDEHKVMYGFNSAEEAREAYLANYEDGWQGLGTITGVSKDEFTKWIDSSHRKTKPFAEYKSVKPLEENKKVTEESLKQFLGDWEKDPENATKAVDDKGQPIVVYRGGGRLDNIEDASNNAMYGKAYYATPARGGAEEFAEERTGDKNNVQAAYINVRHPFVDGYVDGFNHPSPASDKEINALVEVLAKKGLKDPKSFLWKWNNGKIYGSILGNLASEEYEGRERPVGMFWHAGDIVQEALKELGYDGVIGTYSGMAFSYPQVAVFDMGQVMEVPNETSESNTEEQQNTGYTITPATYTTKKGKELALQLVTFDNDLTKEQKRAADKLAREKKGWFDRSKNGYMMRSVEDAEELAKLIGNDAAVQEAQPVSLTDIRNLTDEAESRPKEESKPKVTLGFGTQATGAKDKTNAIRIFQQELTNIINKKRGYADQFKKFDEYRKKYGWEKYADFDLYAVFDNNGNFIGIADSPRGAYDIALNNDFESFMVVRQQPTDEGIEYNATYGWLFTNEIPDSQWRDDKGVLREEVKQKATFSIARNLPDVKTNEVTEQPKADESEPGQETASSEQQEEQKEPKSKYVSDEDAERFAQLKERLRQKLRGQMNMGIDPEIFTLGVEMTYMIVKNQARKFAEYAKAMIEEMGDAIRPYLKTFYNGARDLPELEDIAGELTPYEEVRAFDVANFDKQGAKDLIKTAEVVSKEDEANRQAEQAKEKITKSRNERLDREMEVKRTAAHFPMETPEESAAFDRRIPDMSDEELLAYMKEDGNGDVNKAFHVDLYDEYDNRHYQEEADAYDRYLQQLRESDTTSEQAEEMLGNLHKDKSQFATEDRPLLLGQEEALQDYMSELRNERRSNETEGNSQADTDVLLLPQPIKDNPNYSKEEQESLMYRKGESMEEYGERNNKYPNNWEALYLTQKYSDRMDDIANILSSLSAENADEVGKAIADIVESRSEGYELLSLLRNIPVDAVLPYQDAVSAAFDAKETGQSTVESKPINVTGRLAELRTKYPGRVFGEQHEDGSVTFHDEDAMLVSGLLGREFDGEDLTLSKDDADKALQKLLANKQKVGFYRDFEPQYDENGNRVEQPTLQLTSEQEGKPKKSRTTASSKGKIEDVGEKIGGARKDIVQATVDRININGETFSKIFPKFDYHKLIKEGLDPKLAAGLSHVAQIAKDEYKRRKRRLGEQRALSMARFYANYAKGYLLGDTSLDFSNEGWVFTEYGKNVIGFGIEAWERLYDALGEDMFDIDLSGFEVGYIMKQDNANIKNYYYRDGERIDARYGIRAGQTKYFTEDEKEEALQYLVDGVKKAISYKASHPFKLGAYYTPGVKDSGYIGAKIGGKVIQLTPKGKEYGLKYLDEHNAELQLLAQRKAEELKEERKNSKQIAQVVVISGQTSYKKKFAVKIGGKYVDLSDEMFSFETSDYSKKHLEEMQAKAQELLDEYNKEHGDGKGWKPEMNIGGQRKRVGKDWREGRDVSATELMNKFGFRGVEFGNYVTQKERQRLINECYDAFMDMADVLGVSPRALSLNGELGMAIGARGIGGAAAHYEPAKNVINLTKKNGWGALAHEWWHSLDYYFGQREKAKPATASYFKEGVRKEMEEAFEKVMDRIKGSDYLKRSRSLDRKTNKDYYSKDTELGARAFQDYIEKKLTERGQVNDFLSHFTTKEDWNGERETYPYPIEEEGQKIGNAFESFFDTIQEREDENGNIVLYEPSATYGTRDGSTIVWRSLFDEYEMRGEVNPETTSDKKGKSDKDFNPTELHLRKLKKGETCHVERVYEETKQFDFTGKDKVESSEDVAYIFKQLENAAVENSFLVLVKDGKPTVIHLGMGSYSQTMAPYEKALVAYQSLKPDKVYFIHNHPSGALIASKQDKDLLKRVKQAFGEDVVQQGIIIDTKSGKYGEYDLTSDKYDLIETSNVLPMPQSESNEVPIKVYQFSRQVFAPDWNPETAENAGSPDSIAKFVSSHRLGEHKKMSFLVLNNQYNVVANVFLPWTRLSDIKQSNKAGDLLAKYVHQCGGTCGILYGNYEFDTNDRGIVGAVGKRMKVLGTRLIDVLHVEHSAYYSGWEGVGEPGSNYDTSDVSSEPVLFRDSSTPIFYSNAARAVETVRQDKATPEQWLKMIEKNGGLKSGEDKWIGLSDWLKSQGKTDNKKQAQLQIILDNNPADESLGEHAWIRELSDIKTLGEAAKEDEADTPDFTHDMLEEALRKGKVTVYSSHPIKEGEFVTPSKMEAQNYAGEGKVYSKEVPIDDVAWLDTLQGQYAPVHSKSLTKQEVMDYILSNQIQIEETEYGNTLFTHNSRINFQNDIKRALQEGDSVESVMEAWDSMFSTHLVKAYNNGEFSINENGDVIYEDEMLEPINETRLSYTTQGLDNKREIAMTVPTIESWNTQDEIHFGDAGQGRAVAWVRFGETEGVPNDVDADRYHDYFRKMKEAISRRDEMVENIKRYKGGMLTETQKRLEEEEAYIQQLRERYKDVADVKPSRVLVIDEIQSKRHQEGREKGYRPPIQNWYKDRDELERYRNKLYQKYGVDRLTDLAGKLTPEESTRYDELVSRYNESSPNKGGVPSAPFEKNWHELAMKRMLRYAAENGYDKVAWTTGEQQAERYSLSKTFNSIEREDNPSQEGKRFVFSGGNVEVMRVDDEGKVISSTIGDADGKNLSDLVGKDMAVRLMGLENGDMIEGEDLRIGGEGMKGFYDKILPSFMNKYGKKWGVKVGTVELPNVEESARTMWSIDVTPEMVQSVMEGQPMFRIREDALNTSIRSAMQEDSDMKRSVAQQMGDRLNTPLNIIEDVNDITHPNKKIQERQRRSKGWYDPVTGQVYVVLPNNRDVDDVKATIGHETVAHKGLRELVGEERYNEFLDETYRHLRGDLKQDVDDAAGREFLNGLNNKRKTRSYEECRRIAVDELFGRMAEKPFEEFSEGERTLWQRIKDAVRKILDRFLGSLKLPDWFELGDNELRYILWRSKERLERGKESPIDFARDIVKREELGLGELTREDTELSDIESKAKADGTWMKAPNGKPTNLNERQWLQVRTRAFKEWFGDWEKDEQLSSKIVSDNGEPMVFYHGTNRDFSEFDPEKSSGMMMFTSDENLARKFAAQRYKFDREGNLVKNENGEPVKGDVIMPVYLNVRNPKVIDMDGYDWYGRGVGENAGKDINKGRKHNFSYLEAKQAQREGHDGLILKNVSDSGVKSDHVIVFEANQIKSATNNIGTYRRDSNDIRFRDPDETEDIWNDQSLNLQESITAAKARLASRHSDNRTLRNDAMRAIGGNLSDLRRAMSLQRTFDMTTVKRVSDLARILMDSGYLNDLTQQEVKRLLAAVKNSVGREDIESSVQKVMDIMVDNQLKQGENTLHELEAIKGSKVDARGVEVQGQLDPAGAHIMKVFKKTRGWDKTDVEEAIADAQQRMGSSDAAVADEAALEYTGLQLAMEYAENIKDSKVEERKLREEIKQAHDTTSERDRATDSYRQYITSLQEAIRQNKIERAQGYFDLVGRLSDSLRGSIANAKEFKESEKRRIREIQHNANSDMEGRPSDEHYKPKFMDKFVNNSFVSYVFAPLSTFEQMLRMFGGKSANGEGYLFNRFMRGWVDARQKEIRGVRDKYSILDAKAAELFGGKVRTWGDLIRRVGKLPKGTVSFWNGGEMKECEMTQGNLMYIYMVNKMLDGRMKLRKMGITDEKVADIEEVLDPRLIELADWLQDEFLVGTRNEYNETHKRMFGASMAAIEHYFPLKILANARADKPEDLDNPDKGDGISTATGSIIKRRRNTLALDITGADALSVILDHVAQMEHWNAFAEFNRDLNTLRTYKRFRNQVQNMTTIYGSGRELWKKFNDVCQMAAGTYRPPRAKLDEAAVNFAKGVTAAKVSFRIFTALKQLLSMPAYIPDARADYLLRNIANPVGAWKWSMEHLPIFNERWRSRMVGDPRLMKSDMDWKQWRSRIVQLASRVGMSPNAFVDALTVSIGAHSIYQTRLAQYLRDGYGQADAERKAVQDAEMLYNLTQQSSEGAFTSTMQVDRSWLSVLFTVFRNASMSYQRQLHDALRNFKHNLTPGGRARSIEFMKKQLLREWNSPVDEDGNWSEEDSARAEQTARRKFKRQLRKDVLRVGTFGYIMQLAWNLGAYLPYMLFGDDDDEKQKMWDDVFAHTAFGSVEGLTGGDLMSQAGQMWRTGDGNPAYLSKDMPLTSDITEAFKKFGNGRKEEALNDIINIIVQSGIGVNPQSITDAVLAIMDACGNDVELANEATICISRILQIPQSQIEKMYLDEVGLDGKDVKNYTFSQLAERYARYRVRRSRLFAPWSWDDEERIDKEKERLSGKYKERLELKGDDALRDIFDSNSGDMELRKMAGSEIAKHLGGRDSYGSPKSEYGQIYLQERSYVDIAEDVLLQTAESQAKENGDTEREKAIKRARANITDIKKALAETPYTDAEGNKVTAEDVMGRLRKTRRELMDELDIETQ